MHHHPDPRRPGPWLAAALCLALAACAAPPLQQVEPGWAACGAPHCAFAIPEGFEPVRSRDGILLRDDAEDASLGIRTLTGPSAARVTPESLVSATASELTTAARWSQDPARHDGFAVLGIAGQRRDAPRHEQLVVFTNTRTGHHLVLEASAPADRWPDVRKRLQTSMTQVRLGGAY